MDEMGAVLRRTVQDIDETLAVVVVVPPDSVIVAVTALLHENLHWLRMNHKYIRVRRRDARLFFLRISISRVVGDE